MDAEFLGVIALIVVGSIGLAVVLQWLASPLARFVAHLSIGASVLCWVLFASPAADMFPLAARYVALTAWFLASSVSTAAIEVLAGFASRHRT